MDSSHFLARRRADPRFTNERSVVGVVDTAPVLPGLSSAWYEAPPRESGLKRTVHQAAVKKDKDGKKHLTEGETSDNSDAGVCWSDYERVPGTTEGEKGSCRPKGGKKKKKGEESAE